MHATPSAGRAKKLLTMFSIPNRIGGDAVIEEKVGRAQVPYSLAAHLFCSLCVLGVAHN
jgi:hypothetical protein